MTKPPLAFLLILLSGVGLCAEVAQADPANYAGSSADGSKVFFTTTGKLVPGDTDNGFRDVYERFEDSAPGVEAKVTREISTGPTGGSDAYDVDFDGVSSDGNKVFFSTAESLVAEDEDRATDVYMRNTVTGETVLVSQGAASCAPGCGNGAGDATYVGSTADGSKVFFTSDEKLASGDGDEARDIYVRNLGATPPTTTLVSQPDPSCAGCSGSAPVTLPINEGRQAISADGTKVVFESTDKLAEGDGDAESDIYERDISAGTTALVSVGGTCPAPLTASECAPLYRGMSSDGSKVFLQTKTRLVPEDQDSSQDVYQWSAAGGGIALVSVSGEGEEGKGAFNAKYAGSSPDGSVVFFETEERLSASDTDAAKNDVYAAGTGGTRLVSAGTVDFPARFNRVSADGRTVLFSTAEPLGGGDEGEKQDVYAWSGGAPTLLSAGSPEFDSTFASASEDAGTVYYTTAAPLVPADKDTKPDIYEGPGAPTLISTGPVADKGLDTPHLAAVSADGARAFFTTTERLTVDDDFAGEQDVYERSPAGTLLVSVSNSGELDLGPPAPGLTGTSPGSPGASLEPAVLGEAEPGTSIKLYATPDCSGAPAGTGTAAAAGTPSPGSFSITVTVAAGSTTTFRATATNASGDSSACSSSTVAYRQESTLPPPSEEEPGGGGTGGSGGESGGTGGSTGGSGGSTGGTGGGSTGGSGGGAGGSGGGIEIGGIVYVTPITRITFGPASKTRSRRPVFRFVDATEQPGTSFVCKLDHRRWRGCGSPYRPHRLKPGRHLFEVKGRSAAGQWQQRPVTRRFKIVARRRR